MTQEERPRFFRATSYEERDRFFDLEFARTLGQLLKTLQTRTTIPPTLESRLRKALELRNWLAHRYFWERSGSLLTWDGREKMIKELQEAADFLGEADAELTAISDRWLERVGISKEIVEAELGKYKRGEDP